MIQTIRVRRPPREVLELDARAVRALNASPQDWETARDCYVRAIEVWPEKSSYLWHQLGTIHHNLGDSDAAMEAFGRAIAIEPREPMLLQHAILCYDAVPGATWEGAAALRKLWVHCFGRTPRRLPIRDPDPERPLRVGFSSADFYTHSAAYCFAGAILYHSDGIQVYAYSDTLPENTGILAVDETKTITFNSREVFQAKTIWRDTHGLTDEGWSRVVEYDDLDILIECSGFTLKNRLRALSRRVAPIQVTAWGYATGTGIPAVDYFLADPIAIPQYARRWFTEQIVDLPCIIGYCPPVHPDRLEPLKVTPLPAREVTVVLPKWEEERTPFTFSSFNRVTKHNDFVYGLWARILHAVPHGRLVLKSEGYDEPPVRARVLDTFARFGVDPARICIEGKTVSADHLGRYSQVDLSLDPHPHGGGVSSLESLVMGVPVVTLPGEVATARVTASIQAALGLKGFDAKDPEDYIRLAVGWTEKLEELNRIRLGLRQRLFASPLWGPNYGPAVEGELRTIWRDRCRREGGS